MPWQSLAPLFVVIGMFNVAGALVGSIQYLAYGVSYYEPVYVVMKIVRLVI
jgi:hypothetical protein